MGWFSDLFKSRKTSKPKQGWLESNKDYRERVYREGKERIIEDITGSKPKQGFFESDESYRRRIAHEANERIVEEAARSKPRQGWFESDDYRARINREANEIKASQRPLPASMSSDHQSTEECPYCGGRTG